VLSFDDPQQRDRLDLQALQYVRALTVWKRYDADFMTNSRGTDVSPARPGGAGVSPVPPIRSVGIIGAGVMGAEIAAAHVKHNLPVVIFDSNPAALETIVERALGELKAQIDGGDHLARLAAARRLLTPSAGLAQAALCDLVIESIVEKLSVKQHLFGELQEYVSPKTIIASNTSTIPIGRLAEGVSRPGRFCGFHFCHPVRERPLVEIVRAAKSDQKTIAALVAHARTIDKLPIVAADGPGFLVNRLLLPYLTEALELLAQGASIEEIERVAGEFGMAKGPFSLMDEIGLDTTLQAGWSMAGAFPDRVCASPLLVAMIKAGRLGQKSGAGFFGYNKPALVGQKGTVPFLLRKNRDSPRPDPGAMKIIAPWIQSSINHSPEEIILRLLLPMVAEAARIVEEKRVGDPRDIDLASVFGLGFPARRGGLLWWAHTIKPRVPAAVRQALASIAVVTPSPAPLPLDLAGQGEGFAPTISP
jgi:3-hydroxyacyl-CoA dehydrogenase